MMEKVSKKKVKQVILIWIVLAAVLFLRFYDGEIKNINATMMAFHYGYGFISRGLVGTVYALLDKLMPGSMYTYAMAMKFTLLMTGLFFLLFLGFVFVCIRRAGERSYKGMVYLLLLLTIFAVPMFVSKYNFGRLDLYLVMISLAGAVLLIEERAEWLVVPLTALGIMIHQGYAFMYYNILLVLVFYKWMSAREEKKRRRYQIIFFSSLLLCIVLFFWFEVFSHVNGQAIVGDITSHATGLCQDSPDGEYHRDVIDHEILGIDLTAREKPWRMINRVQFPLFLVLFLPYILLAVLFFAGVWKGAVSKQDRLKYLAVILGALTMVPELLLKVDYGRWMFAILCYYLVVVISLQAMGDEVIEAQICKTSVKLNQTLPVAAFLLAYAVLFQPFLDVCICDITADVCKYLNDHFLHLWSETIYYK